MCYNLNEWLLSRYNPVSRTLNITQRDFEKDAHTGIVYEEIFIQKFMHNPNPFLEEYHVKNFILRNGFRTWNAKLDLENFATNNTLDSLDLQKNNLDDIDAFIIGKNKALTTLNLSGNKIGDKGIAAFADNKILKNLYVSGWVFSAKNRISPVGAKLIANITSLEKLDISNNSIGNEGGVALVKQLTNLKAINLKHTNIGQQTVDALFKNENLTSIKVSWLDVGCKNKFRLWRFAKQNKVKQKLTEANQLKQHEKNQSVFNSSATLFENNTVPNRTPLVNDETSELDLTKVRPLSLSIHGE